MRASEGEEKGAAQAAGALLATAWLLEPSTPKCPKVAIPIGQKIK